MKKTNFFGNFKDNSGFTLIEILMVVFLFGLIVTISSNLFFSTLKGGGKGEITKEVKENGEYALSIMERSIRNAKEITSCTHGMNTISIKNPDNGITTFQCLPADNVLKIASNSSSLTSKKTTLGNPGDTATDSTGCTSSTLSFDCDSTVSPPRVTISFTLKAAGSNLPVEEQASADFKTTVYLRTY